MNNKKINIQENSKGAALIWAIFAIMIVAIFLGTIHTLLMSYVDRSVLSRDNRQAYLTARSVCNTLAEAIIEQTDTGFNSAIASMNIGDKIEIKDISFQLDNTVEESHLNPTEVMPEAKGSIIKESEDILKVVGEAKVGKGEKSVGAILREKPKGSNTMYISGGMLLNWPILHTGQNTDIVIEKDFVGVGDQYYDPNGLQYREFILQVEDGDLMVKGNVEIIRISKQQNSEGQATGFINGKVIADGNITLQNVYVGNKESYNGGIYTPGNVTLETTRKVGSKWTSLDMHIYGDIVCNRLDIYIDTQYPAQNGEQLVIYGNIQAEEGVFINDKPLVFSKGQPKVDGYWVEDFRPEDKKKLVIMGTEANNIPLIITPPQQKEPKWVTDAPQNPQVVHLSDNNPSREPEILEGGKYYMVEPLGDEGKVDIFKAILHNVTPDSPVTLIIPSDTRVKFTQYIPGVYIEGEKIEESVPDIYSSQTSDKETYKKYQPRIRFILEQGTGKIGEQNIEIMTQLELIGDSYVHIYGKEKSRLIMENNALLGSFSVDKLNTAGENNAGGNISYHAIGNAEGTGGSGSYEIEKYINP